MSKIYKRTIYQIVTTKYSGTVAVDQDRYVYMYDTAPCYKWAAENKMSFSSFLSYLKRKKYLISCKKIGEDIDPF